MNRVEGMAWASAGPRKARRRAPRRRVPTELGLVAVAMTGELVGALTHPFAGAALAIVAAVVLTLHRMGADVRALRAWDPTSGSAP